MESLTSFLKQLGNKVHKIRTTKNMTQEELCDKAGIFRSQLARIEKGDLNITVKTLKALADAFELDSKELLNF